MSMAGRKHKENYVSESIDTNDSPESVCTCPFCGKSFPSEQSDRKSTERVACHCMKCGYSWNGINSKPSRCPKCRSKSWNRPDILCRCLRCGHEWVSKRDVPPSRCPGCRSNKWNEEPTEKRSRKNPLKTEISSEYLRGYDSLTMDDVFRISNENNVAVFTVLSEAVTTGLLKTGEQ